MNHAIMAPVLLPAAAAAWVVLAARGDLRLQRRLGVGAAALLLAVAAGLFVLALDGRPRPYLVGDWPAPFGIVLVLDRLSALLVLLTSTLGLLVAGHAAATGLDRRGRHFHALLQFQLMGLNGAFLTGDIFNLFVFFEVLLIASYGLALHGGGRERFAAGLRYVAVNLTASMLFLFAVGLIYGVTGTLNMADLAMAVPRVPEGDLPILRAGAALLLVAFGIKAALVPLHFWLPGTYAAAPAPVAALFAIMTKVGAYAILRVYTLIFGAGAGAAAGVAEPFLLPAAALTLLVGALGALQARGLARLAAFAVLWSMGTLFLALGTFTAAGLAAALYYLVHSTLAGAALFFVADLVAAGRGPAAGDRLGAPPGAPVVPREAWAGALFLLAALGMAGLPPLSGFVGKLLVLDALREGAPPGWPWLWAALLGTSLVALVALARAGSDLFWRPGGEGAVADGAAGDEAAAAPAPRAGPAAALVAPALLVGLMAAMAAGAGPATRLFDGVAAQLKTPDAYLRAVLGPGVLAPRPGDAIAAGEGGPVP